MHIHVEKAEDNAVQAYSETQIKINEEVFQHSFVVSKNSPPTLWGISHINELHGEALDMLLIGNPEIIIIGHQDLGHFPPMSSMERTSSLRIGLESMSIGAACRTYNILLSEGRIVTLGIIIQGYNICA